MQRINPYVYAVSAVLVFFLVIAAARGLGYWSTSGKIDPKTGEKIQLTGADPDEIKGWMTLGEVCEAFDVPVGEVLAAFGLPADIPPGTPLKEMEKLTAGLGLESELSPGTLKEWLKERLR